MATFTVRVGADGKTHYTTTSPFEAADLCWKLANERIGVAQVRCDGETVYVVRHGEGRITADWFRREIDC